MGTTRAIALSVLTAFFAAAPLFAQPAPQEEAQTKEKELPKSGKLAGSLSSGYDSRSVEEPWGGDVDLMGNKAPPITGSVSKNTERSWVMRIVNNSGDTYAVDLEVEQYGSRNNKIKSDYFSYTLKSKQRAEREIPTLANVSQCILNLQGWRNLTKRAKEREAARQTPQAGQAPAAPAPAVTAAVPAARPAPAPTRRPRTFK